jgi:hypothetical protein
MSGNLHLEDVVGEIGAARGVGGVAAGSEADVTVTTAVGIVGLVANMEGRATIANIMMVGDMKLLFPWNAA